MRSNHPPLADDTFERDQLALLVLVRRIGRDVDVAAVVTEDRAVLRGREALARLAVEPERVRDAADVGIGVPVDVDPEQLGAAQPLRTVGDVAQPLDPVPVEQDRFAHPHPSSTYDEAGLSPGLAPRTVVRAAA